MALTDAKIKNATPREKPYRISDAKGLYVEVHPNGSKYWRLKYRFAGKEKRLAIGVYPRVTLKATRKACELAKDQLDEGIDPSQAKKAKKVERAQEEANNLEAICLEWHCQQAKIWSDSYADKVLRSVERDLFPYLGTLPLDQISPPQLLAVLRKVESRGASESAHRLKQTVRQVFRYAVATGRAQRDITPDLKGALATHRKQHFPAITEPTEAGRLLNMIDAYEGTATVRAALKLAPLVFVRPKELRQAEWNEIDFENSEWRIPGTKMKMKMKMKMGEDHIVPLSTQSLAILEEQKWNEVAKYLNPGAIFESLKCADIPKFKIKEPPKAQQIKITHILSSINDKIELNQKTNKTLEQMAQALFKSWFVDFDPVIDNALAAGNAIPPELQKRAAVRAQLQKELREALKKEQSKARQAKAVTSTDATETATPTEPATNPEQLRALFPSEFEHTEELGWVPKGWEVKSLKELASKISKGTTPRKADMAEAKDTSEVVFLKVRDITDDGYILKDKLDLIPVSISTGALKRSILKTNDILVPIAGTIGRVTVVDKGLNNCTCNQAVAFVRLSDAENILYLAKLNLQSQRVQEEMPSKIVQAVQANFSSTDLGEINILIPSADVLHLFNKSVDTYFQNKSLNMNESMSLTKLRDTLLPKLISGELRLPESLNANSISLKADLQGVRDAANA